MLSEYITYIQSLCDKRMDLSLERIRDVARRMRLDKPSCPVITVGGTNGKGSTVVVMEHVLTECGYRVGTFTSPHIIKQTELIRINNNDISEAQLCVVLSEIDKARGKIVLTEFEFMTLAALWLFQQENVDYIILEVGLGGRDDAVNIIDPTLAIITNIELDHGQWLGNDRESIAAIKAGIFREGITAIVGDCNPPLSLLNHAKALSVNLKLIGCDFDYQKNENHWCWQSDTTTLNCLPVPKLIIDNVAVAIMALQQLINIDKENLYQSIHSTLKTIHLPGRWQIKTSPCLQILDVAHNPAAAKQLAMKLKTFNKTAKVTAIFSMFADKAIADTLKPLANIVDEWHIAPMNHPRAASLMQLSNAFQDNTIKKVTTHNTLQTAHQYVQQHLKEQDILLIFGSFQVLAEISP